MTSLRELEREAEVRRADLDAAFRDLRKRLTLPGLADEAAALLDPGRARLVPAYSAVKRHPMLAAALLAGAGWLFKQGLHRRPRGKSNGRSLES